MIDLRAMPSRALIFRAVRQDGVPIGTILLSGSRKIDRVEVTAVYTTAERWMFRIHSGTYLNSEAFILMLPRSIVAGFKQAVNELCLLPYSGGSTHIELSKEGALVAK